MKRQRKSGDDFSELKYTSPRQSPEGLNQVPLSPRPELKVEAQFLITPEKGGTCLDATAASSTYETPSRDHLRF